MKRFVVMLALSLTVLSFFPVYEAAAYPLPERIFSVKPDDNYRQCARKMIVGRPWPSDFLDPHDLTPEEKKQREKDFRERLILHDGENYSLNGVPVGSVFHFFSDDKKYIFSYFEITFDKQMKVTEELKGNNTIDKEPIYYVVAKYKDLVLYYTALRNFFMAYLGQPTEEITFMQSYDVDAPPMCYWESPKEKVGVSLIAYRDDDQSLITCTVAPFEEMPD